MQKWRSFFLRKASLSVTDLGNLIKQISLMFYDFTTNILSLGTVQGGGYDCRTNNISETFPFPEGRWNKVREYIDRNNLQKA